MKRNSRLVQHLRLQVFKLYAEGKPQTEIADIMHISVTRVQHILTVLNDAYRQALSNVSETTMPLEFYSSIVVHKTVMNEAFELSLRITDSRTKLEAYRLVLECRRYLDQLIVDAEKVVGKITDTNGKDTSAKTEGSNGVGEKVTERSVHRRRTTGLGGAIV